MALPACQQRVLDGIAGTLQARDPRLAALFSIFTRLNRQEPMPRAEELTLSTGFPHRAARGLRRFFAIAMRLRPIVIVPVALAAIAGLLILAPLTSGQRACGSAHPAATTAMPFSRVGGCEASRPSRGYVGR
jgi:hypothetical protein